MYYYYSCILHKFETNIGKMKKRNRTIGDKYTKRKMYVVRMMILTIFNSVTPNSSNVSALKGAFSMILPDSTFRQGSSLSLPQKENKKNENTNRNFNCHRLTLANSSTIENDMQAQKQNINPRAQVKM